MSTSSPEQAAARRGERATARTGPGEAAPLGVHWDGHGVNVAVPAPGADSVSLCLFDRQGRETRVPLPERDGGVWHGYVTDVGPGQRYGLRADGPYSPERGLRYNPAKLLVDPYARCVRGGLLPHPAVFGYAGGDPYSTTPDTRDSAPYVPICEVVAAADPHAPDPTANHPATPWPDTVVYELHVKGFTKMHPAVPERLRGSYAGLGHPAAVDHLRRLGVTAVELLPVHAFVSEPDLPARGLTNYWGYNSLGFFAPHAAYAVGDDPVEEFRTMVWTLHDAGIEVLLDVVYNHTAEGGERGPTLSLRGLDNQEFYRLEPTDPRRYRDVTGVGNTLNTTSPHVVKMICDSLRYWVEQMGVDGFRFDLATALARNPDAFDPAAKLLTAIHADPVLSRVKLIAEPWDVGWGGYQVGAFPAPWAEWNGRFRDAVRDVWNGRATGVADLGYRITGSSDLYDSGGRRPWSSVNFVTAHDGFPLADVVSYDYKHNDANGEGNRDGEAHNRSANHGVEGLTDDARVLAERQRVRRGLVATLLLSTGVPMLVAGDELGRSQGGNNNAYCQDNPISWLAWPGGEPGAASTSPALPATAPDPAAPEPAAPQAAAPDPAGPDPFLFDLVAGLLRLRREEHVLTRRRFFHGGPSTRGQLADITWFRADGAVMSDTDWHAAQAGTVVAHLAGDDLTGDDLDSANAHCRHDLGHDLLLVLRPATATSEIQLPRAPWGEAYDLLLDTGAPDLAGFPATVDRPDTTYPAGDTVTVTGRSVLVFRARRPGATGAGAAST